MSAKELFNKLKFNLTTSDDKWLIYEYKTDYDKIYVYFYKDKKTYKTHWFRFIDNTERTFVPMNERPENIKHSASYGYWQIDQPEICNELHNAIHQQLIEFGWISKGA